MIPEKKELIDIVDRTLRALKKNRFEAIFVRSRREALQSVLDDIPHGAVVGAGDSVTLQEIGLFEELRKKNFTLYWPFDKRVPKKERRTIKIVNVDASGNRVAGMIFGPKKSIIVVGINKIVENLDKALERIKNVAAPLNAKRIREERGWELLPCVETGKCVDCNAENRICNVTTIIEKKPRAIDMLVIIVGEELGL